MSIGTRRSAARPNTGSSRGSSGRKRCARGWSLMPRAPRSRQRRASSIGVSSRSRRTNGTSSPGAAARVRERAVVRRGERGVAVGLVEAERERARDPVGALDREQLVAVAGHAVDVLAEVRVDVEDVGPGGKLGERERRVLLQQVVRAADRVHGRSLRPRHSTAASTRSTNARLGHRAGPGVAPVDDDRGDGVDAVPVRLDRELGRLDPGRLDARRREREPVRQQHGRRAVRSGRRDEDVDGHVALERGEALARRGRERRLRPTGLDDPVDERRQLVSERHPEVARGPGRSSCAATGPARRARRP